MQKIISPQVDAPDTPACEDSAAPPRPEGSVTEEEVVATERRIPSATADEMRRRRLNRLTEVEKAKPVKAPESPAKAVPAAAAHADNTASPVVATSAQQSPAKQAQPQLQPHQVLANFLGELFSVTLAGVAPPSRWHPPRPAVPLQALEIPTDQNAQHLTDFASKLWDSSRTALAVSDLSFACSVFQRLTATSRAGDGESMLMMEKFVQLIQEHCVKVHTHPSLQINYRSLFSWRLFSRT